MSLPVPAVTKSPSQQIIQKKHQNTNAPHVAGRLDISLISVCYQNYEEIFRRSSHVVPSCPIVLKNLVPDT